MVTEKKVRLNKYISQSGLESRRKADQLIEQGEVRVNGHLIKELGYMIDPKKDHVKVSGKMIRPVKKYVYYMLNKPTSVLSTVNDPEDRKTVMSYCQYIEERIFPVGRLDWDSEGLLLMTNDGDFAQEVSHPSKNIPKTYMVKVEGLVNDAKLEKLRNGVSIPGGRVKALVATLIPQKKSKHSWLKIVIEEGKNRQIRHMMAKIGCDVIKLQRTAIGMLKLGALKKGQIRPLEPHEIEKIFFKFKAPELKKKPRPYAKPKDHPRKTRGAANKKLSKADYFKMLNKTQKESE
jgi:23S rRNA pseudouridine2605 synthase